MIAVTKTTEYVNSRIKHIESRLTSLCLQGSNLAPRGCAMNEIRSMNRELIDLTDGKNTIAFDRQGRPFTAYVIDCNDLSRAERYGALLGGNTARYSSDWENILPCFIRNNSERRYLLIQKYKCSRVDGKNQSVGLYGLPPAYGESASFALSYDGLNAECDRLNEMHHDGLKMHMITWDEMGMLMLKSGMAEHDIHGNTDMGRFFDNDEFGTLCGHMESNSFVHTLNGSGIPTWKHTHDEKGVDGLNGNLKTLVAGIRIADGEIQLIDFRKTDGCLDGASLSGDGLYKAIENNETKVSLVNTGSQNTLKIDFTEKPTASSSQPHMLSTAIRVRTDSIAGTVNASLVETTPEVVENPLLRFLGLIPYATNKISGYQRLRNDVGYVGYLAYGSCWNSKSLGGASGRTSVHQNETSNDIGGLLAAYADSLEY